MDAPVDLDALLARPGLLVLGLDRGRELDVLVRARARHPEVAFARLDLRRDAAAITRFLGGDHVERLVVVKGKVILIDSTLESLGDRGIDDALELGRDVDPALIARRSLEEFADPGPEDAATFARGLDGRYRNSLLEHWILVLSARGACEHREAQSGVQGSSSDVRSGRWARLPDGRVELRWEREDSDLEVGMITDRSSRGLTWNERVRLHWKGRQVVGIRFDGDRLAGARMPEDVYRRAD